VPAKHVLAGPAIPPSRPREPVAQSSDDHAITCRSSHSLDLAFQNLNLAPKGQHLGLKLSLIGMAGCERIQQDANHRIDQRSHHAGAKS
jgi:hypothetical protein